MRESITEVRVQDVETFLKSNETFNIFTISPKEKKYIKIELKNLYETNKVCFLFDKKEDFDISEAKGSDKIIIVK